MNVVKFHNRAVIPPRGGWIFPIQSRLVNAHSESQLIEELVKVGVANKVPVSRAQAELEIWTYFCHREPERCRRGDPLGGQQSDPDVLTPEVFGPIIWRMLNLSAVRFQQRFFFQLLDNIPLLMTCEECRRHWREVVGSNPSMGISTAKQACLWVNKVHNEVNARTGKQPYAYERMVAEYGAPP